MVRLLLNSQDAAYDSSTKKYSFVLDRRLDKPEKVRVVKAHYTAATTASYPLVVYLRSDALSSLIRSKHTLRIKNQNHEATENILGTLSETHAIGRYDIQNDGRTFVADPHQHLTNIDIFWTNNDALLNGGSSGSSSSGGGSGSAVTDATIEAFNDLTVWMDLAPARTLTAAFATCSALGDLPRYLYSRSPSPAGLIMYGNWDFELVNFKTGLLGISRDTDPSAGHGQMLKDSTFPTSSWDQEFQVHHIFKTHTAYTQTAGLFDLNNKQVKVWITGNGGVVFRSSGNQNVTLTNIVWIPDTVYILSIKRAYNTTSSAYEFLWRMENVVAATVVSETSDAGEPVPSGGSQSGWSLGIQGMYYRHVGGPLIGCNGIDQTEFDNSITWMKNWYGTESEEEEEEEVVSQNASWFVELEIDQK